MKSRIEYLDGHRGLAILLVISFHAYARWTSLVPYGDQYSHVWPFRFGWLGVELFFLLSGFVILMTLEKCSTAKEFLYRRWLRLFPGMLICSVVVFATASFFSERPAGVPTLENLLPGLTFLESGVWKRIVGHPINPIEGAFWSLFVEFKFYFFAAFIYYLSGRRALVGALFFAFLIGVIAELAGQYPSVGVPKLFTSVSTICSFGFFGWFASGAAFYIYSQNKSGQWLAIALFAGLASSVDIGGTNWQNTLAACLITCLFAASVVSESVQRFLGNRFLQFFGVVSYPLYLIHENMMISIIIKLGRGVEWLPIYLLPISAVAILSGSAFLIAKYCEPRIKMVIEKTIFRKRYAKKAVAT